MFEKIAYAQDAASAPPINPIMNFMPFILIFIIFYFLLMRPQQKRQQELQKMIADLKKGDKVTTVGGILGVIHSIQDDYVVLRIGDNENSKVEVLKSAVSGIRNK